MEQRIILVTGTTRGIGREITRQCALQGHVVIATGRTQARVQAALDGCPGEIHARSCDVRDAAEIEALATWVNDSFGKLDGLINNAGILDPGPVTDFELTTMQRVMETNVYGPVRITGALWPLLVHSADSRVINLSSGMGSAADITRPDHAAYRLSKWSLNGWTRMLATGAPDHVTVAAMCPGWVRTDMGGSGASRSVEKGAETAVWLATAPGIANGHFWRDRSIIPW